MLSVASETGAAVILAGILVWSSLGGATAGVVAAAEPTTVPDDNPDDGRTQRLYAFQATGNETNGSAIRHENPIGADEDGDTDDVAAYLARSLANSINRSTLNLSRGEYELAKSHVGEQYRKQLSQYIDVEGSVTGRVDPEKLRNAGRNQREMVNETREFNEVYERYEEAKQAGNTERARRLARELDDISENISQTTRRQRQNLRAIDNSTSADLNETIRETQLLNRSVQERRQAAVELEFVRTELTVEAVGQRASFRDPLTVRGRLTDVNGTVLTYRSVEITVGDRNYTVRTDSQGQFRIRYRPTTLRTDSPAVTVRYVPAETSVYRSASARVPVTVEQTTPTLSIARTTTTVRYGETVAVRGRVFVGSVPVPNVPVAVTVGDTRIATARTDAEGVFQIQSPLPADVADGERPLGSRIILSNRAIAARNETTDITVVPTETNLTVSGIDVTDGGLEVAGRLTTDAGAAVPGQQVELRLDGTTAATGTTNRSGVVRLNVSLDTDEISRASALTLRYDGTGTNLDSAAVRRNIPVGGATGEGLGGAAGGGVVLLIVFVVSGFVGSGLYVELRRLYPSRDGADGPDERGAAVTDTTDSGSRTPGSGSLDAAASFLGREATDDAVRAAYFAVRDQIPVTSASRDRSHWQYYESLNGALDDGADGEFHRLTELYEYAAFAEKETTMAEAREALEAGWSIVDAMESDGTGTDAD